MRSLSEGEIEISTENTKMIDPADVAAVPHGGNIQSASLRDNQTGTRPGTCPTVVSRKIERVFDRSPSKSP